MIMLVFLIVFLAIITVISLFTVLLHVFTIKVLKNNTTSLARFIVGLLVLQFILGMLANLFQSIPTVEPWLVFHDFGYIMLHTFNAMLLVGSAIIFLMQSIKQHENRVLSVCGLLSIIIAFISGVMFVNAGQNDIFSFTMALGFIAAILMYAYKAFSSHS